MPNYNPSPNGVRAILAPQGSKTFLLGTQSPTGGEMNVTSVATASNVATAGVNSWSGPLPVVGTLITIRGTVSASGAYNVSNVPVTAVTLDANGTGTVSFALTSSDLSTTADAGKLYFFPQVSGETVVAGSTIPASPAFNQGRSQNNYAAQLLPDATAALPTAATFTPQHANENVDAAFSDISGATALTIAAGAITVAMTTFATDALFVRFRESGITGSGKAAISLTL